MEATDNSLKTLRVGRTEGPQRRPRPSPQNLGMLPHVAKGILPDVITLRNLRGGYAGLPGWAHLCTHKCP